MRPMPIVPTIFVAAAVAVMIGLGIWQLQRAEWKEGLLARYEGASALPPIAWPASAARGEEFYFRKASGFCVEPVEWRPTAGRNLAGEAGWSFIVGCRTGGAEGPGMHIDMGWSKESRLPQWRGGEVSGVIAPDEEYGIRLVSAAPAPGLESRLDTTVSMMPYSLASCDVMK